MRKLHCFVQIMALALVQGVLFFSCAFNGLDNNGTLLITLPGAGSTGRAISGEFTNTLHYRIECTGSGPAVTIPDARPGAVVSIPLSPGDWTITVTVNNSAREEIGRKTATAVIESGKPTTLQIPITIDTSRSEIKSFEITEPVQANGVFDNEDNEITITVPAGTNTTQMKFTVIHTGKSIKLFRGISPEGNPIYEELLNLGGPLDFNEPQEFVVTAEDGENKTTYTIIVKTEGTRETEQWPDNIPLANYGLDGIPKPEGIIPVYNVEEDASGILSITMTNVNEDAFMQLQDSIEEKLDETGSLVENIYALRYTHSETSYSLFMSLEDSTIILIAAPSDVQWPSDRWRYYNLSGLTQPEKTDVSYVSPVNGSYIIVILDNGDNTVYEALLGQIKSMKFIAIPTTTDTDYLVHTDGSVHLQLTIQDQKIIISASRSGYIYDWQ